jgi:uncharacterized protein YndB with AHSA1/START domain
MNTNSKEVKMELIGETEVVFTRYFNASREIVYDCHTKPELMRRWLLGPEGMVLERNENDVRVGGKYLYLYSDASGNKGGVYGHFIEVASLEKFSNTENYIMDWSAFDPNAPEDPNATVESRTFTTDGNMTLLTHRCKYASAEIRKFMIESGACEGMAVCYEGLDKLLSEKS